MQGIWNSMFKIRLLDSNLQTNWDSLWNYDLLSTWVRLSATHKCLNISSLFFLSLNQSKVRLYEKYEAYCHVNSEISINHSLFSLFSNGIFLSNINNMHGSSYEVFPLLAFILGVTVEKKIYRTLVRHVILSLN